MTEKQEHGPGEQTRVRLLLLGPASVIRDGREIRLGDRQRAVLGVLATRLGDIVPTERLMDRVWDGDPPPSAGSALRVHLSKLRALLSADGTNALQHVTGGYRLDASGISTDVAELRDLVSRIDLGDPAAAEPLLAQALGLYRGEPLADLADQESRALADTLVAIRERLTEDRVDVLLALGLEGEAAEVAAELVRADPLRERRTRQLMLALYRSGRQADALAAGGRLRDLLREELGVDPDPDTARLEVMILRQDQHLLRPRENSPVADRHRVPRRPLPHTGRISMPVRQLVTERLTGTAAPIREVATIIAMLDDLTDARVVAAAAGLSSMELEATLDELADRGLVATPVPGSPITLHRAEFATALVELLPQDERAAQHRRVADGLERVLSPDAYALSAVAWHRLAGLRDDAPDIERTLGAIAQAATSCLASGFAEAAQELCDEALALDIPARARLDLARLRLDALNAQGRIEQAEQEWEAPLELARNVDDPERFALVALTRMWAARSVMARTNLATVLAEALQRLGPANTALRVRVQAALLMENAVPGRLPPRPEDVRALRESAAQIGDPESLRFALLTEHALHRATPDVATRVPIAHELLRMSRGLPRWECWALSEVLHDAFVTGRFADIPELLDRLETSAAVTGPVDGERPMWLAQLTKASLHRDMGRFPEADRVAEAGLLRGAAAGLPDALAAEATHRLISMLLRDSTAGFLPSLQRFAAAAPHNMVTPAAIALALTHAGRPTETRPPLELCLGAVIGRPNTEFTTYILAIATEALWAGAPAWEGLAEAMSTQLLPYSGQFVALGLVSSSVGPVDRTLGLLSALAGDVDAARAQLLAAQHQAAEAGTPVWEIRAAADRVPIEDADTARELAERYAPRARELGMAPSVAVFDTVL